MPAPKLRCEKCGKRLRCIGDSGNICRDCWYDSVTVSPPRRIDAGA